MVAWALTLAIAVVALCTSLVALARMSVYIQQTAANGPADAQPTVHAHAHAPEHTHAAWGHACRMASPVDVRLVDPMPAPPIQPPQHGIPLAQKHDKVFKQVGIVFSVDANERFPLFWRAAPHRRHRHQYYVATPTAGVQLAVRTGGRDCTEELGCEQIASGDEVSLPELGARAYTVKLFAR